MILLRQKLYTSRATKELRRRIIMSSGEIKKYKSEGYRTVERSPKEIAEDLKKKLKEKYGRGWKPLDDFYGYDGGKGSQQSINSKINSKGILRHGFRGKPYSKDTQVLYDHGSNRRLTYWKGGLRYEL